MTFQPTTAAQALIAAHLNISRVPWATVCPADVWGAYAIQDATLSALGPIGGWKVGAKDCEAEPICAPLPASCVLPSGTTLSGSQWRLRGVEVELGLRVGRDLDHVPSEMTVSELAGAFDAVLPVIEVLETRLDDWEASAPVAKLADLQSHGALLLGTPAPVPAMSIDLQTLVTELDFNGRTVARTQGGNPAGDIWQIVRWLIKHCVDRRTPLRRGQIVTTGSCTGVLFAEKGTHVEGRLVGLGSVEMNF